MFKFKLLPIVALMTSVLAQNSTATNATVANTTAVVPTTVEPIVEPVIEPVIEPVVEPVPVLRSFDPKSVYIDKAAITEEGSSAPSINCISPDF